MCFHTFSYIYNFTPSHPHTLTPSYPHSSGLALVYIFIYIQLYTLTPSQSAPVYIQYLCNFALSHPHILTPSQFNLVGQLLGPKGLTLQRMQAETQTRMTILGRGSIRDKKKEEELRDSGDPAHAHLNEDLHILVEVNGLFSEYKLRAGVAEVRKMLIPTVSSVLLSNPFV